jgi:membrane-associated phospholipid phosphatase
MAAQRIIPIEHPRLRGYNPLDWLTLGYFALTGAMLAFGHSRIPHGSDYLVLHIGIVLAITMLGFVPRRGHILVMFFRDTYPMWCLPFLYKEVGVLDRVIWPGRFFDSTVLGWEKGLFGLFPSLYLHEWFPNHYLSEFFHFSYFGYYFLVPILGFWLYLRGREEVCRVFGTTVMLTFFTCYLIFILFPVAGPWYVFIHDGPPVTGFFATLVHNILSSGASRGAAFPSSHVAGALTVLWMTARFERPLLPLMGTLFMGIFIGVVYGGFHYGVDALGGFVLGALCSLAGPRVHSWLLRRSRLGPLRIRFPHLVDQMVRSLWRLRRGGRSDPRRRSAV